MATELTINVTPFFRHDWSGRLISLGGAPTDDFTEEDVAEVIAQGEEDHGGGWDGECAAVLRLKDGRYVSYETFWGPTGDGFCADAYGGTADLQFAYDEATVVRWGLTDNGRKLCGYPVDAFGGGTDGEG